MDPAYYYTLPGYSWDAMLKHTDVELDLINDIDMLMFIENGIRGGITQCSTRYSSANNKYMDKYKQNVPNNYLMYYDINAMYSWAMSQYLPIKNLKWVENVKDDFNFNVPNENPIGFILEVDLEFPDSIHDKQRDLPMAPVHQNPPGSRLKKMLLSLDDKTKYVIHYRNLKAYISEGVILKKIHRVLQFEQSNWLKKYIDLNTILRQNSTNEFEKNLYKLMNNAIFGKTMENVRNRRVIKLITKWEGRFGAKAYIAKPNFHRSTIFAENFVAIELTKTDAYFNKPIYVGMAILDISKTKLYDFHYKYMQMMYGDKCRLLYTDTDSLIYSIQTEDVYEDMKNNIQHFDTSDYQVNNIYNIPLKNKKIPGLMKDENNGRIMTEFVGLRAKMYSIKVAGGHVTKRAKGVKKYLVNKTITFEDYKYCLENCTQMSHEQRTIMSKFHDVYSRKFIKVTLNHADNKRYILTDNINTLPWGHFKQKTDL